MKVKATKTIKRKKPMSECADIFVYDNGRDVMHQIK